MSHDSRIKILTMLALALNIVSPARSQSSIHRDAEVARVVSGLRNAVEISGQPSLSMTLEDRMSVARVPGVAIAVIEEGEIVWARGFGVLQAGGEDPVTASTLFMTKSLSKPVTAVASLVLVDRGFLTLDRDVNEQLLSWSVPDNEYMRKESVTLRRLLTHTAGLSQWGVPSYRRGEQLPTLQQALDGLPPADESKVRVDFVPGSRWRYSGGGYSVLQQLLIDVTGQSFSAAVHDLVLAPTGMHQSGFLQPIPILLEPFTAVGHGKDGTPIEGRWETLVQMAAGGLLSNVIDLARFVVEVEEASQGRSDLLTEKTALSMLTVQKESGGRDGTPEWGLGFELHQEQGTTVFHHTGSGDGFKAILIGHVGLGQGAVVLCNGDGGGELRYEILRSIAHEYGWPSYGVLERASVQLPKSELEALVGRYVYEDDGYSVSISMDGADLGVSFNDGLPQALFAESASRLFTLGGRELTISVAGDEASLVMAGWEQYSAHRIRPDFKEN